jgi:hypothetical protein
MPELLTPPRRSERIGPTTTPAISVRYLASAIWLSREARLVAGAWLRNVGSEVARHLEIPDLAVGDGVWCRFQPIEDLEPGEEASLDPVICLAGDKVQLEHTTLTAIISRTIVSQVLAGRAPRRTWTLRVEYENCYEQPFVSECTIELAGLPLTLRALPTRISRR